jgi:hypothetical protein
MKQRGETLATIAELAGVGVGEIRAVLRYIPKAETDSAGDTSGALRGGSARQAGERATEVDGDVVPSGGDGVALGDGHAASAYGTQRAGCSQSNSRQTRGEPGVE